MGLRAFENLSGAVGDLRGNWRAIFGVKLGELSEVPYSLCGAVSFTLVSRHRSSTLAATLVTGRLEPGLLLAGPTASTSSLAVSPRLTLAIATMAVPFAA